MPPDSRSRVVVLRNIPFAIEEKRVLRELRIPKVRSLDEMDEVHVARAIREAIREAYTLIHAQACYRTYRIQAVEKERVRIPESDTVFQGESMVKLLRDCDYATLMACHLGPAMDQRVSDLEAREPALAFYLDRVGAWMADYVADAVDRVILQEIQRNGYERTFRFAVGYGDWPLTCQAEVLRLVEAHRIGLHHTETFILVPRFAVSAVIGWKRRSEHPEEPRVPDAPGTA